MGVLRLAHLALMVLAVAATSRTGRFFQELLFNPKDDGRLMGNNMHAPAPEQWFTQHLDHYNPADMRTWQQRYYVNATYWGGPGYPIFLMLGGEGPVNPNCVGGRFVFTDWAAEFKAMAICVEHRFYGKSVPTADTSVANLKYLTSQQALADYAYFRQGIHDQYRAGSSKWVAFGGSYSGSLSAWQRIKYPHLFAAAVASSAPVMAQEDYPEYFAVVAQSLGPDCAARVAAATKTIDSLLDTADGRLKLQDYFQVCDNLTANPLDAIQFAESISDPICGIVQYNNDNNGHGDFNVDKMCSILMAGSDPVRAYANAVASIQKSSGDSCIDSSYQAMVAELKNVNPTSDALSSRSWTYQTCTEYGYFQRTKQGMSPFSSRITLDFFEQICKDVYGLTRPDTAWTNIYYGSNTPAGSKIVYPNGGVDPWHVLGVLSNLGPDQPFQLMDNTAHCADLYMPRDSDDSQLKAFRAKAVALLHTWLSD